MKTTTQHTKDVWVSGDFAGNDRKATHRATIQKLTAIHPQYRLEEEIAKDWAHASSFQSVFFGQVNNRPRELPNIQSIKWTRGTDSDVGSCTIVLANVEIRNDKAPASDSELDFPGYFTPNRGDGTYFSDWGYIKNEWANWLIPDRIIRTFEGYGTDPTVAPEKDPYLYPSGVWKVDDVIITHEGTITLECRDLGALLLDQVMSPPAIPWGVYPLYFEPYHNRAKPQKVVVGSWLTPAYTGDSNIRYKGKGVTDDDGTPVVAADGTVFGHHGRDAFDTSTTSAFWSVGYRTRVQTDAFAWVQGKVSGGAVQGVRVDSNVNGGQRVYISLKRTDGTWVGRKRIPYSAINVNIAAKIPYVHEFKLKPGETAEVALPKKYTGIKEIRYTFGHLPWTTAGYNLNFRTNIARCQYASTVTLQKQAGAWQYGNYADYSNIVKWLLAWAGWYWPDVEQQQGVRTLSDGDTVNVVPSSIDSPTIPNGRVWGDFEMTGTKGITKLDVDVWDKKPFMDGIAAVREVVGFDFWIDETGGGVWRLPNVFKRGCYIMPTAGGARTTKTQDLVEIDERTTLIGINEKLSGKNIRERVYVGNAAGHKGAVVRGYYPDYAGLRRYAGWTDQRFGSNAECEQMADLIALRQMFLYRQTQITITANPAIQPDDQIIITERTTGEGYIHRVIGIQSEWSAETGQWTYTLTTNWLGDRAFTNLAWNPAYMRNVTRAYLQNMKRL